MAEGDETQQGKDVRRFVRLAGLALRRPRLYAPMLRAAWRFRARGWYRRPPFLPLPPREYMAWRLDTAYADPHADPPPRDLERYLRWTESMSERRG